MSDLEDLALDNPTQIREPEEVEYTARQKEDDDR